VKVEVYTESLCPDCADYIINYLNPFFNNGLIDIVELRIIPYGNARIHLDGSLTCQHGEDECYLNIIQTCAIRLWPKVVPSSSPLLSLPSFFLSSAVLHNFVLPQKWMQSEFFSSVKFCMIYMVFSVIKKVSCNFFLDLRIIKFGSFWICLYINRLRSLR
jgi:hypothetical protein